MCTCTSHVQVASLTRLRLRRPGEGGGLALRQGGQRPAAGEVVQACSWALLLSAWALPRAWVKESESRRPGVRWRPVLPPQETGGESPALLPCHFGGGGWVACPVGSQVGRCYPVWDGAHRRQSCGQGPGGLVLVCPSRSCGLTCAGSRWEWGAWMLEE